MTNLLCGDRVSQIPSSDLAVTTYFAPAGRDTPAEIQRKLEIIQRVPLLTTALDAMPAMVMILNRHRQIVAANRKLRQILDRSVGELADKRPGEALQCIRAKEGPNGCGTSEHCSTCGAVRALMESMTLNAEVVRECRILVQTPTDVVPLDLRVTASPFVVDDEYFVLAVVEDTSYEKRVSVLQRTFFHDILNTVGCIQGYADYLAEEAAADPEVSRRLLALSGQLIEEIHCQRDLMHAESGDLKTRYAPVRTNSILDELRTHYSKHSAAAQRHIVISDSWDGMVLTDRRLLLRVLGNMIKNALEATPAGGSVSLECSESGEDVTFSVRNPGAMARDVQLQVFQRSFSTKGEPGRGIGTYSMKLFGERYLGGKVNFTCSDSAGTTFCFCLPKKPN